MSDSQTYEKQTVSSDGVTVDKRFEADEFPVPAIAFEIESARDESVTVTLVDDVPEDVVVEDLGFHPEYGSEYWTIDDDQITFERDLDAGAEYTTVYGIRATGTDNVEKFLTEPALESVDPDLDAEADAAAVVGQSGSDVVRDVISGDSDSVPGLEGDEEIETLNLKDPTEDGSDGQQAAQTDGAEDTDEDADDGADAESDAENVAEETEESSDDETVETTDDESVASETLTRELAEEIRQGNVSGEDIKLLRQALELAGKEGGSVDARLEQLQSDVSDLRAYTTALEEFLDDNGTGKQLIEDLQEDIDGIQSDISELDSAAASNSTDISALQDEVDDLDDVADTVGDLERDVERLLSNIKSVENDIEDIDERLGDVDDDVSEQLADLEDEIEELNAWREQLSSVIGG